MRGWGERKGFLESLDALKKALVESDRSVETPLGEVKETIREVLGPGGKKALEALERGVVEIRSAVEGLEKDGVEGEAEDLKDLIGKLEEVLRRVKEKNF